MVTTSGLDIHSVAGDGSLSDALETVVWLRLDDNLPEPANFADYHRTGNDPRARRRFGQRSGLLYGLVANDAVYAALVRVAPNKPWLAVLDGYGSWDEPRSRPLDYTPVSSEHHSWDSLNESAPVPSLCMCPSAKLSTSKTPLYATLSGSCPACGYVDYIEFSDPMRLPPWLRHQMIDSST